MKIPETLKKAVTASIIIVILSLGFILTYLGGLYDFLEYKLYDFRVNLFASAARASDDIILILLDQDSIDWAQRERGWGWPWPREAYAEITDYLNLGGANSLAFDVLFTEPSIYNTNYNTNNNNDKNDDEVFASSAQDFGRTIQIVVFSGQTGSTDQWPGDLNKPFFELRNFETIRSEFEKLNQNATNTGQIKALFPIRELRNSAGIIGNVTGWADSDNIFRRNNLFTIFDGKAVPGLSAASLIMGGASTEINYNQKKNQIEWGDRVIPVDKNGRSILHFRGDLDRYHPYWAWQILQSAQDYKNNREPLLNPEDFAGRYVFFGFYAQGLYDVFSSPVNSLYPGVGIHVTMLDNILQQDFIRESPLPVNIILILATIILIVMLALINSRIVLNVGGTVIIFVLLMGSGLAAYRYFNLWIPMAAPMFAALISFITTAVYNYATEGRKKRFIKSAFSQYLSPVVIDEIIADPKKLNLGGETRDMTAIFTDIQKFSSISEILQKEYGEENGPRVLVNLLNLYLTEMSNIILQNKGTIDKYEGDAIIAFFGAPVWSADHAALACRSAIAMKKREAEIYDLIMDPAGEFHIPLFKLMNSGVIRSGRPLYTRLGVNSGKMVVGNMGTPNKMDYTIMGNSVNLAARLEGVNKQYNTGGILISEYTKDKINDEFVCRPLSRVRVVGINTPLRLYELLDLREEAPAEILDMEKSWKQGFNAYENQDFMAAKNIFTVILQKNANDSVAKLYLDRCNKFIANPPAQEAWDDGVDSLTEK
ncbi:MAG: adenylate/guanylate cyclase domain-containing protein [Treponema sp.]|nr:adenylate/guanylate cyclase domain-containing protein [Treponema sp.]